MTRLDLLGTAWRRGPVPPELPLWLCAVLAVEGSLHSREALAALLWPEADAASAHNRLRQVLFRVRRSALGPGLADEGGSLRWKGGSDVADFRVACAASRWDEAITLYAGPLLDGLTLPDSGALADWLLRQRADLQGSHLRALEQAGAAHRRAGRLPQARACDERLLAEDPLNEEAVTRLMRDLQAEDQTRPALTVYQRYCEALRAETGGPPGAELQALARQLRRSRRPVPAALHGAPEYPNAFVGRGRELGLIAARLDGPHGRWLSVVGPGGSGKTRLALQAAQALAARFEHGAVFVSLAGGKSGLAPAVLAALGLPPQPGDPDLQLRAALAARELLLVLDNFESVQEDAGQLPGWLAAAPGLRLLVTSRHRLEFQAESVLLLFGLPVAQGADGAAAQLFIERALRADAQFDAALHAPDIERVCRRCEGLPLAVELAAAWVDRYSMSSLASTLEEDWDALPNRFLDAPEGHRSLRTVFEQAWQRLPAGLLAGYSALAALRTPFGRDTAQAVAGVSPHDLRELERRSLLQLQSPGLYTWHQQLREFAWAQQDQAAQRRSAQRHLEHFLKCAEEAAPQLRGPGQAQAHAAHAERHDDLRAALEQAEVGGQWPLGLRLASALHWFWYVRGYHAEGALWLGRFLAHFDEAPPSALLLRGLIAGGSLAGERGLYPLAEARYRRALAVAQALSDPAGEAEALHLLGVQASDLGQLDAAALHLGAALALRETLAESAALGTTLNDLGILAARQGQRVVARTHFQRSLELKRQAGDTQGVAYALANLGAVSDDLHEELLLYQQSLALKRELGDLQGLAKGTFNCAVACADLGDLAQARGYLQEALGHFALLGKALHLTNVLLEVVRLLRLAGAPGEALTLVQAALGQDLYTGVPLPAAQREKLEEQAGQLVNLPDARQRRERGRQLTPAAALECARQALQSLSLPQSGVAAAQLTAR